MASQCPKCHEFLDEEYVCCAGVEFQWKCQSCNKRDRGFAIPFGRCIQCGGELVRIEEKGKPLGERLKAVQEAVQIEISSYHFYHRLAEAVEDPQVSDFFESLSFIEKDHAEELGKRYHLHKLQEKMFVDHGKKLPQPFFDDLSFFADTGDAKRLYNCAIDLEKRTLQHFLKKAEILQPGKEKELFLELAAEEREHITILESERDRSPSTSKAGSSGSNRDSLFDLIENGIFKATDLKKLGEGVVSYDPALLNTATCRSAITFIDGDQGILRYRGYPIEALAEKSHYLEVAYLLSEGELPNKSQAKIWENEIRTHTMVHENIKKFMDGFHYDAHPMGILVSTIAALSTFYKDAKNIKDAPSRHLQKVRLMGKMITLAAYSYRHSRGLPYVQPDNELSYVGNFLNMLFKLSEPRYVPNPVLEKALDLLFLLHADHEQNASTNVMRCVGSSRIDPFTATSAAAATLYGPLHGGANEEVLVMLRAIGSRDKIPAFLKSVRDGERKLMGFGHRVYKNYDPRATIIKKAAYDVFEVTGKNPLLDIALELERIALEDDYFVKRKLYPNVDFYSGLIYQAMGFPVEMFPVLFAIGRTSGWLAQWEEMLLDPEQKIARPRQIYIGPEKRDFVALEKRR